MKSLAEHLGTIDPRPEDKRPQDDYDALVDITDPVEFCQRLVATREFRQYLMSGVVLGDLPPAVVTRILDHAWGKPVERVEHSGRVEAVTEVRRVVIHVDARKRLDAEDEVVDAIH